MARSNVIAWVIASRDINSLAKRNSEERRSMAGG